MRIFMAAVCTTGLPHPRPGRAVAVGPRLLIRQGKPCLFRSCPLYLEAIPLSATGGRGW